MYVDLDILTTAHISGGSIGDNFETDGVVNLTGGEFLGSFEATANAQVNVFGSDFEVNGVPVPGLVPGVPTTIFSRGGVPFSATLADGTPFEIDLNTLPPNPGDDFVDFNAILTVTLIAPGDFDIDGDVDGFDFLKWQRDPNLGELADWEANFGTPTAANATAVPEPGTVVLAVAWTIFGLFRRRSQDAGELRLLCSLRTRIATH